MRVLEAGKHCFVEKPLAQSVADAEGAVAAAERAGRVLDRLQEELANSRRV